MAIDFCSFGFTNIFVPNELTKYVCVIDVNPDSFIKNCPLSV